MGPEVRLMGLVYDTLGRFLAVALGALALAFMGSLRHRWRQAHVCAWGLSLGLISLGMALFGVSADADQPVGLAVHALRNGLVFLGLGFQLWGWARATGRVASWGWVPGPALLFLGPYLVWADGYPRRVVVAASVMAGVALLQAGLLQRAAGHPLTRWVQGLLLAHAGFLLARARMALLDPSEEALYRWTAYGFTELFAAQALMGILAWLWLEPWLEDPPPPAAPGVS